MHHTDTVSIPRWWLCLILNIAAQGKGLAKASLPSNHLVEAGAGALWAPEGMRLPLTLEEKQMKMFILGAVGILLRRGPSLYLKIVSYVPHFGFFTYLRKERKVFPCRGGVWKLQWWDAEGISLSRTCWQGQEQCRSPLCCVQSPAGLHSTAVGYPVG